MDWITILLLCIVCFGLGWLMRPAYEKAREEQEQRRKRREK